MEQASTLLDQALIEPHMCYCVFCLSNTHTPKHKPFLKVRNRQRCLGLDQCLTQSCWFWMPGRVIAIARETVTFFFALVFYLFRVRSCVILYRLSNTLKSQVWFCSDMLLTFHGPIWDTFGFNFGLIWNLSEAFWVELATVCPPPISTAKFLTELILHSASHIFQTRNVTMDIIGHEQRRLMSHGGFCSLLTSSFALVCGRYCR